MLCSKGFRYLANVNRAISYYSSSKLSYKINSLFVKAIGCSGKTVFRNMGSKNSSSDATSQIDEEWKKRLTPEQYHVCREKGTERPFTGIYNDHFEQGTYLCVCCDAELFESDTKFNSHCGWPAFSAAKKVESKPDGNVARNVDMSHGMIRTEVTCAKCGAHLGHVFDDGPTPTGERFCINSISLKFQKPKN